MDETKKNKINNEYDSTEMIRTIKSYIGHPNLLNVRVISFEKDDDKNQHINFITSMSNIRSQSYHIDPMDSLATKRIAGKIIPAIATTTSIVAGLVAIELYKTVYGQLIGSQYNTLQRYRYGSFNLAVQLYGFSESYPAKIINIDNVPYSIWSQIIVDPDTPLRDLLDSWNGVMMSHKNKQIPMSIDFISSDRGVMYSQFDSGENAIQVHQTIRDMILQSEPGAEGEYYLSMSLEQDDESDSDSNIGCDDGNNDINTMVLETNQHPDVILTIKVSL